MPIDSKHPDYDKHLSRWKMCADFNEGSHAVKEAHKLYLPRPEGMENSDYKDFLFRASFFNGVGRTVTGLVGAMTRVDSVPTLPPLLEHLIEDATGDGKTLQECIKEVLSREMITGRKGIFVDKPVLPAKGRVRFITYNEDAITNWRVEDGILTMLVLEEWTLAIDPKDVYEASFVPQYRELWLDSEDVYHARLWKPEAGKTYVPNQKTTYIAGPTITPETSTGTLSEIPFVICSPNSTGAQVVKAPLADLCEVNQSHYMVSADLEHGRHLVSLPTPWVTGVSPDDYKRGLKIGSGTAWVIDNHEARVGMLEFTGKGLGHLAEAINEKQHQMAILGAKLLQPQRKQVESAELARMANAGDESILVGIAKSVGLGFRKALYFAALWEGADPSRIELKMNTDFIDTKLAPEEMSALLELYLSDVLSLEEFMDQLKVGERLIGSPSQVLAAVKLQAAQKKADALKTLNAAPAPVTAPSNAALN